MATRSKAEAEWAKAQTEYQHAHALELTRATTAFEHAALRPLFLLNGGALIAVVAFMGATWGQQNQPPLGSSLVIWTVGLVLATVVTILGYVSQFNFMKAARRTLGNMWVFSSFGTRLAEIERLSNESDRINQLATTYRLWAEMLGVLSLICFVVGVFGAIRALTM